MLGRSGGSLEVLEEGRLLALMEFLRWYGWWKFGEVMLQVMNLVLRSESSEAD